MYTLERAHYIAVVLNLQAALWETTLPLLPLPSCCLRNRHQLHLPWRGLGVGEGAVGFAILKQRSVSDENGDVECGYTLSDR